MPRTLLVTGASGYLGSCLVRQAREGWRVVGTCYSHAVSVPGVEGRRLDLRDPDAAQQILQEVRPDVVIHAASDMRSAEAMDAMIEHGTRYLAAAVRAWGAPLIHMSTDVLFDGESGPYAEDDAPRPTTPYGRAKARAERWILELCPSATIVRTSLICGFAPPDPRTRWVLDSLKSGLPITLFTDELRCPVWVEQLAGALLELAGESLNGTWHLAGPQAVSRYQLGVLLARAYGLEPAGITPGLSRDSGLDRPRDCRLDTCKAQTRLKSPLWGIAQVMDHLGNLKP